LDGVANGMRKSEFEATIRELTAPLNGQFPRPWMTELSNPLQADVFVVGKNQRNGCPENLRGGHQRHIDALFNRNGETCRRSYDEVTGGSPSPTRRNTDRFIGMLRAAGAARVLETNVICYSSPMSSDLRLTAHSGGAKRGAELFAFLLDSIAPRCLIVHGAGSAKELSCVLGTPLATEPSRGDLPCFTDVSNCRVYTIPSLAPPAYNKWAGWAEEHLASIAESVGRHVAS
jgi:hypothetical protein